MKGTLLLLFPDGRDPHKPGSVRAHEHARLTAIWRAEEAAVHRAGAHQQPPHHVPR